MPRTNVYVDLDGREICLEHLDAEERALLARIRRRARTHPDWADFRNYWVRAVAEFCDARRVPRKVARESAVYRVAQDLSSRLGIAAGLIRPDDYRSELGCSLAQAPCRHPAAIWFPRQHSACVPPCRGLGCGVANVVVRFLRRGRRESQEVSRRQVMRCGQSRSPVPPAAFRLRIDNGVPEYAGLKRIYRRQ